MFRVPLEERRYKKPNESAFGDDRQRDICRDIMAKTGAAIEISSGKDQGLTIMVTGKPELLAKARRMVLTQLQTQVRTMRKGKLQGFFCLCLDFINFVSHT